MARLRFSFCRRRTEPTFGVPGSFEEDRAEAACALVGMGLFFCSADIVIEEESVIIELMMLTTDGTLFLMVYLCPSELENYVVNYRVSLSAKFYRVLLFPREFLLARMNLSTNAFH